MTNKKILGGINEDVISTLNSFDENAIAYGLKWDHMNDAKFLSNILKNKIKVRYNKTEFTTNGIKYNPGSLVIYKGDQTNESTFNKVVKIANDYNRKLNPIYTGMSEKGPDLGSSSIELIKIKILQFYQVMGLETGFHL